MIDQFRREVDPVLGGATLLPFAFDKPSPTSNFSISHKEPVDLWVSYGNLFVGGNSNRTFRNWVLSITMILLDSEPWSSATTLNLRFCWRLDYWRNIMGIDRKTVRVIFFAQQQNLVSRIADSSRPGEWTGLRQRFGSIPFSIWDMISLRWSSFSRWNREWSRGVRNSHRNVQNLISECFVAISEMNRLATLCTPAQTEDITQ